MSDLKVHFSYLKPFQSLQEKIKNIKSLFYSPDDPFVNKPSV